MKVNDTVTMFLAIAAPCVALPQAAFVPSPRPHPASEKSVRIIPGMDDLGAASGEFPQEVMEHAVEKLKEAITDTINAEVRSQKIFPNSWLCCAKEMHRCIVLVSSRTKCPFALGCSFHTTDSPVSVCVLEENHQNEHC
mmetsp:Transcript_50815/g.93995  ORF Transcript_50815/g.93995 Transcript_50815/m.93995 type:complete len:139 (-) Transcript_50815:1043-1459(-)